MICDSCGYNLPWHDPRCAARNISPIDRALERINEDDAYSHELCASCGHRFGYGKAKIMNGQLVHAHSCD